jgi:hypothetical protein
LKSTEKGSIQKSRKDWQEAIQGRQKLGEKRENLKRGRGQQSH